MQLYMCPKNTNEIFDDPLFNAGYTLGVGSPALLAGDDGNDMGAYGGSHPMTW
jgi:hypothetical protein